MNTKECPIQKCLFSFLCVFAFMLAYEIFEHDVLLAEVYKLSAAALRPVADMDRKSTWYIVHTALLAGVICCLYMDYACAGMKPEGEACATGAGAGDKEAHCPFRKSIRFGLKIGMIMGLLASRNYAWLPIHMNITMAWFFGSLAEGVGIGLILGLVSGRKPGGSCGTGACGTK